MPINAALALNYNVRQPVAAMQELTDALNHYGLAVDKLNIEHVKLNRQGQVVRMTFRAQADQLRDVTFTLKNSLTGWDRVKDKYVVVGRSVQDLTEDLKQLNRLMRLDAYMGINRNYGTLQRGEAKQLADQLTRQQQINMEIARRAKAYNLERNALINKLQLLDRHFNIQRAITRLTNDELRAEIALLQAAHRREVAKKKVKPDEPDEVNIGWLSVGRLVAVQLFHRALSSLVSEMSQAVDTAREFSIRIAEIESISEEAQLSTERWRASIADISTTMGFDLLDVSEGMYQTISNQVAKGEAATRFLYEASKLATAGVSSLSDAVEASTGILNAYHWQVDQAARVNAVLFKTVELGRLRLEDMAHQIGRSAVLAKMLGVSYEEMSAALSTLTVQGIDFQSAQTFLVNAMMKLVRPTEAMQDLFKEWGVNSGQAAVQTFSWVGVLEKLMNHLKDVKDPLDELGQLVNRIRGVTGFAGLTSFFGEYQKHLNQMLNASESYMNAVDVILNSPGKRFQIEVAKMKKMFVVDFGESALDMLLNISNTFGGLDVAVKSSIEAVSSLAAAWTFAKVSAMSAGVTFNQVASMATKNLAFLAAGFVTTKILGNALGGEESTYLAGNKAVSDFTRLNDEMLSKIKAAEDRATQIRIHSQQAQYRGVLQTTANITRVNTQMIDTLSNRYVAMEKVIDRVFKRIEQSIDDSIRKTEKSIDKIDDLINDVKENVHEVGLEDEEDDFSFALFGASSDEKMRMRTERMKQTYVQGIEALRNSDFKTAKERFAIYRDMYKNIRNQIEETHDKEKDAQEKSVEDLQRLKERKRELETRIVRGMFGRGDILGMVEMVRDYQELQAEIGGVQGVGNAAADRQVTLATQLRDLEAARNVEVKHRIEQEQLLINLKEQEKKKEEAALAARMEVFQKFQEARAQLQNFDIKKGTPDEYAGLLQNAMGLAGKAGFSADKQLELMDQLQNIAKLKQVQGFQESVADLELKITKQRERNTAVTEAAAKAHDTYRQKLIEVAQAHERILSEVATFADNIGVTFGSGNASAKYALQGGISGIANRVRELDKKSLQVSGDELKGVINERKLLMKQLEDMIKDYTDKWGVEIQTGPFQYRQGEKNGGFILEADALGNAVRTTQDVFKSLQDLNAGINETAQAEMRANFQMAQNFQITQALTAQHIELKNSFEAWSTSVNANAGNLQQIYAGIANSIRNMRMNLDAVAGGGGGKPAGFAFGTDMVNAKLTPGESVIDARTTRKFFPVIQALRRAGHSGGGGSFTSVGDINITVQGGSTSHETVDNIARQLRRGIRLGTIRI